MESGNLRLFGPRLWLGAAAAAAVTSFLPIMTVQRGGETVQQLRVYDFYAQFARTQDLQALGVVAAHLAACFALSLFIRWRILKSLAARERARNT
jgi:hypothetical protein